MYIVVVDDVMTTGASAEFLAQALVDTGARRVDIWCSARTPRPGPDRVTTAVQ
jgi:predicted amidophosphoribosyltransferase